MAGQDQTYFTLAVINDNACSQLPGIKGQVKQGKLVEFANAGLRGANPILDLDGIEIVLMDE